MVAKEKEIGLLLAFIKINIHMYVVEMMSISSIRVRNMEVSIRRMDNFFRSLTYFTVVLTWTFIFLIECMPLYIGLLFN